MTNLPLNRLRLGLLILAVMFAAAVFGYRLAGWSLIDSIYMVVITLSTVGYRDQIGPMSPALKIFTILVIIVGVSTAFYILGGLVQMMAEGEINRAMGLHRVTREIKRLSNHVIICGFGRMGEILAHELSRRRKSFVVLEHESDRIAEASSLNYLTLNDDATEEETLRLAGIARAECLVATLPRDADNVFITLTARTLNPGLQIIARGEFQTTEKKLMQAGADRVVLPAATCALRMAAMITRPSAVELIEVVAGRQMAEVEVDELTVSANSPLVGVTIREAQPRAKHGLLIVAFRPPEGQLKFNPGGDAAFEAGTSVVVMGHSKDIDRFRAEYGI